AYGYKALGDFFVFLFFGPVAIFGCVFLHSPDIFFSISSSAMYSITFASLCMGFATTSVLNINNIRDIEKDKAAKKITLPVLLGFRKAKIYHLLLVSSMLLSFVFFGMYAGKSLQVVVVMFLVSAL